jgi:hypothetical protein
VRTESEDSSAVQPALVTQPRVIRVACIAVLLGAVALLIPAALRTWNSEFTQPDEPAHFTTGVLVYDYLRTALG